MPTPDLSLLDSDLTSRKTLEHAALSQIRKHSQDAYSRLHSIAEDVRFVRSVREAYPSYPVFGECSDTFYA